VRGRKDIIARKPDQLSIGSKAGLAQPDAANRTLVLVAKIAQQLDGVLEHFAVVADSVVQQAVAIEVVCACGFDRLKHSRTLRTAIHEPLSCALS
jgi:hypothetical protein